MRQHSVTLPQVLLDGSFNRRLIVDVFHGTDRVLQGLPVGKFSFTWDYGEVGFGGSLEVTVPSPDGRSMIPRGPQGVLSPHAGARVLLLMEVTAGPVAETVQLGWARIVAYSNARDTVAQIGGVDTVVVSQMSLELAGLEIGVIREGLLGPSQPPVGATCYSELRRLTGFVVEESLPDKPAPALTYEAKQGGRWEACLKLGDALGGALYVTPQGWLTVLDPDPELSGTLTVGQSGTITDYTSSASTDGVYNQVVGSFEDATGNPLVAVASLTDSGMGVSGGYGPYTRYYSSDFVKTQEQANNAVESILSQYTWGEFYDVPVTCVVNPLVEVGDRWKVVTVERELEGRVKQVQIDDGPLMKLVLEVARVW